MSTVLATTVPRKKAVRQAKPVARYWKGKAPKGADALPSDSEEEDEAPVSKGSTSKGRKTLPLAVALRSVLLFEETSTIRGCWVAGSRWVRRGGGRVVLVTGGGGRGAG